LSHPEGKRVIRCEACGTENPPGTAYCTNCARKLDAETQAEVVRQRASHTATGVDWSRVILAVVVAIIVVAVLAVLVVHVL
jgi:uncharacterized OB-fold protein